MARNASGARSTLTHQKKSSRTPPSGGAQATTVVIGDGWSAMAAVGFLSQYQPERSVIWLSNSGSRLLPVVSIFEQGPGVTFWQQLCASFDLACASPEAGVFVREFKNKSFRLPAWSKSLELEARREVRAEYLWNLEASLVPLSEVRCDPGSLELSESLRQKILEACEKNEGRIDRREGLPVSGFRVQDHQVTGVVLGSGEVIACDQVIYADRWTSVPALTGLPKGFAPARRREPVGILQAVFTHRAPFRSGLRETFFGACHKDAGETIERHVWGYFSADGKRSVWTLALEHEEGEDNHQIAKKLRRLKQALDRMFVGPDWLPQAPPMSNGEVKPWTEFSQTVESEQVRFEESVWFASGEAPESATQAPHLKGAWFVTDGYGPSSAFQQVAHALGVEVVPSVLAGADTEANAVDLLGAASSDQDLGGLSQSPTAGHEIIDQG